MFENKYEECDEEFVKLVNMYTSYKGDEALKEIILQIYEFIQSTPYPKEWLNEKTELFNIKKTSFEKTIWGKVLFEKTKEILNDSILRLEQEIERLKFEDDTEKIVIRLTEDIEKLSVPYNAKSWDELYEAVECIKFERFPVNKKVPEEIKDVTKALREEIKKGIQKIKDKILIYNSDKAYEDISIMYNILVQIKKITLEFADNFAKVKKDKNIMDFSDVEHFALEILTKNGEENYVCKKYKAKFEEILIDEYQDSNLVQETILNSISNGNNTFMVGDVKQSIYKFRQARPELFLDKYERYKEKDSIQNGDDLKIKLFKNFRSRQNILSLTNIIFDSIMSKKLGDIDYTKEEYLNLGADYPEGENLQTEVHIIDKKEEDETFKELEKDDSDEEEVEKVEDIVLEAKFVANKIRELLDSDFMITTKEKTKRKITYKDIALLLRSTKASAPIYEQEISKLGIPVFCDTCSRIS